MPWRLGACSAAAAGRSRDGAQRPRCRERALPAGQLRHARNFLQDRLPILGRLLGIVPPQTTESRQAVFRQLGRTAETVPARGATFG